MRAADAGGRSRRVIFSSSRSPPKRTLHIYLSWWGLGCLLLELSIIKQANTASSEDVSDEIIVTKHQCLSNLNYLCHNAHHHSVFSSFLFFEFNSNFELQERFTSGGLVLNSKYVSCNSYFAVIPNHHYFFTLPRRTIVKSNLSIGADLHHQKLPVRILSQK